MHISNIRRLNYNIELEFGDAGFWRGRKTWEARKSGEKLSEKDKNQPQTCGTGWELKPGHIVGRGVLLPLSHFGSYPEW